MREKLKAIDKKMWNNKYYKFIMFIPRKIVHVCKFIKKYGFKQFIRESFVRIRMKTSMGSPLVSVVMPVYNAEDYLEKALDTLLNQSVKHIEIITVDDGSTDSSLEILRKYAASDQRVHVLSQENKYAGAARNLGLATAKGEYVIFLDSDDFFEKHLIKDTYYIAKMKKADMVMFGANYYDNETGKRWRGRWMLNLEFAPSKQPFCYKDCPDTIYQISTECPWTKLFRRKFIIKTGLQFQHLHNANDVFFVSSATALAERIVTLDKTLVNYRIGLKNNLQSSTKRCFYEALTAWHDKLAEIDRLDIVRRSYVSCALGGCLKNLRVVSDPEAKKEIFYKLKNEVFETLEIYGHEEEYYYNKRFYNEMMLIKNSSFEQFMAAQEEQK